MGAAPSADCPSEAAPASCLGFWVERVMPQLLWLLCVELTAMLAVWTSWKGLRQTREFSFGLSLLFPFLVIVDSIFLGGLFS